MTQPKLMHIHTGSAIHVKASMQRPQLKNVTFKNVGVKRMQK